MAPSHTATRRLAAIMFSDICGFSRMMGANEAHTMKILARHDQLVNASIAEHGGRVIKRMGDGVMTEFQSAVTAVECAIAIPRRLHAYNKKAPEAERFQVRIGVHLGDIMAVDNDILGDGVNVASRIEPLATPGGICITQDVYNQIQNKIEVETLSIGPQQLKNIARQIEIYRVLLAAADREAAAKTPARAGARRPRWVWALAAAGALLLLLVILGIANQRRREREARTVQQALAQAADLLAKQQGAEARALLEQALTSVRPETPRLDEVRQQIELAKDAEETLRISERYIAFTEKVLAEDWDGCLGFVDTESQKRHGQGGIQTRLKIIAFVAKLGKVTREDIRVRTITLARDRQSATLVGELRSKGQWKDLSPSKMIREKDDWFMVVE